MNKKKNLIPIKLKDAAYLFADCYFVLINKLTAILSAFNEFDKSCVFSRTPP